MRSFQKRYCKTEIISQFPQPAFIENIAGDDEGNLYVTSVDEGRVYKIAPQRPPEQYAQISGRLAGICRVLGQTFLCGGWSGDGMPAIFLLGPDCRLKMLIKLPTAQFLNGIALLEENVFLICDAYKGVIWKYDLLSNQADIWLGHHLLSRMNPDNPMPAANGIKIFGDRVFVSNTARQLLLSIPLIGNEPGEPDVFLDDLNLDDFAIDGTGTIYATTHIYNSVIEITAGKQVVIIAEADQGLAGSTSAMLGRTGKDDHCLYVTTNGGLSLPLPHGLEDGKVVKIQLK